MCDLIYIITNTPFFLVGSMLSRTILDSAPNAIVHKHVRDQNTLRVLSQPLNERGYPDPPSRPLLAKWVRDGWDLVTPTII